MKIKTVSISNFKSIRELNSFSLGNINVLIGSNGVGKTNFISFLKLVKQIANKNLQNYVAEQGGANNVLYFGRRYSKEIDGKFEFDSNNAYGFKLKPSNDDNFYFEEENAIFYHIKYNSDATGYLESRLTEMAYDHNKKYNYEGIPGYVKKAVKGFEIYHFHDTTSSAPIKQACDINDNRFLRNDGSNLAAYLYFLKQVKPIFLNKIEGVIKQIAPFFESFVLQPLKLNQEKIRLEWKETGSDAYFNAHQLSDGTIRMIALATLLLQPDMPDTIIIDEPELGLHPAAIHTLAGLIRKAAHKSQIIISTQSVTLVNQFEPKDLIVVDRKDKQTVLKRLDDQEVAAWLEDYSLGEAWEKNILGGRP